MATEREDHDLQAGLPDLQAHSPEPDWLPEASDEARFDQIFEAMSASATEPSEAEGGIPTTVRTVSVPDFPDTGSEQGGDAADRAPADSDEPDPAPAAAALPSRRQRRMEEQARKRRGTPVGNAIWALLGLIGLVLLVMWAINALAGGGEGEDATVERNPSPGADGVIAKEVPAAQLELGDCLTDYTGPNEPATVVTCSTPHVAQLVGRKVYAEEDSYPGDDALVASAQEFCTSLELEVPEDLDTETTLTRPIADTWKTGDRTVDCLMVLKSGTTEQSFLPDDAQTASPEPEESSPADSPTSSPSPTSED